MCHKVTPLLNLLSLFLVNVGLLFNELQSTIQVWCSGPPIFPTTLEPVREVHRPILLRCPSSFLKMQSVIGTNSQLNSPVSKAKTSPDEASASKTISLISESSTLAAVQRDWNLSTPYDTGAQPIQGDPTEKPTRESS